MSAADGWTVERDAAMAAITEAAEAAKVAEVEMRLVVGLAKAGGLGWADVASALHAGDDRHGRTKQAASATMRPAAAVGEGIVARAERGHQAECSILVRYARRLGAPRRRRWRTT